MKLLGMKPFILKHAEFTLGEQRSAALQEWGAFHPSPK